MKTSIESSLASLSSSPSEFANLYEAYVRRIYDFVFYRLSDKHEAEDVTSEIFFKAFRSLSQFRGKTEAEFTSWLFAIAYRLVVDVYRKRGEESVDIDAVVDEVSTESDHTSELDNKSTLERVTDYLDTLPKAHKDILIMAVWDELPYDQIASIMKMSEANCRQIVSRTLRKIEANVTFLL